MLTPERHRAILLLLSEQGRVTIAEITKSFNVSTATARRDVVFLAESGKATRSHGGLLPANFFQSESGVRPAAAGENNPKDRIARRACDLLPHEGNIFIDAGTTTLEVGRLLIARPDLHIFTNSVPLISLAPEAKATLIGIGGEIKKGSLALTGALAQAWLAHLRFDAAVIGAAGLDVANGAYANELGEAAIKTNVLQHSVVRVLVADATKWNRPAAVRFASWSAFTSFVTNQELPGAARTALAADKVKIYQI
ncbi:MAG: DeoR/GlpR family DNA-binding transcription regulator [Pseudolabrys sp.]|nr:DeoR/GlpR family DNA-binding transcription regulator [Pseudolabrys sp.]